MIDLHQVAVFPYLRIVGHGCVIAHWRVSHADQSQDLTPLGGVPFHELFRQHRQQLDLVGLCEQRRGKSRIFEQCGKAHRIGQRLPGWPRRTHDRQPPVPCLHHAVRAIDERMTTIGPAGHLAREEVGGVFGRLSPDLATQQRHIHPLTEPRTLPGEQRGQDARRQMLRTGVIGNGDTNRGRFSPVAPGGGHQPPSRLPRQVGTLAFGVGADGAECRPGAVDQPRMMRRKVLVAKRPGVHGAGFEVADDHVSSGRQAHERRLSTGSTYIQGHTAFAPVAAHEVPAQWRPRARRQPSGLVPDVGQFHLDDISAEVRQQCCGLRPLDQKTNFHHTNSGQCAHTVTLR